MDMGVFISYRVCIKIYTMDKLIHPFAKKLANIRKSLGLTQEEFAKKLDVNVLSYRNYEYGRSFPTFEFLEKLHKVFKVNLNYLVSDEEEPFIRRKREEETQLKKYLAGRRILQVIESLGITTGELLANLTSIDDELVLEKYLREEESVPENVLREISQKFCVNYRWLVIGDKGLGMFKTERIYMTSLVNWIQISGYSYADTLFTTEAKDENGKLYFAVYMRDENNPYEGVTLYDPTNYSVWNWFDEHHKVCYLYENFRKLTKHRLGSVKILEESKFKDLAFGKIHPQKVGGLSPGFPFIWDLWDKVFKDFESRRGKHDYGLARLLVEWFYKCESND